MKKTLLILLIGSLVQSVFCQQVVKQWEPVELSFTADETTSNPYLDYLQENQEPRLKIVLQYQSSPSVQNKITVIGFWDGGQTWKVRFSLPVAGEWSYISISPDSGMNNIKGEFLCEGWTEEEKQINPTRRGFVYVNKGKERTGRYFVYADGTPFLWIGDTWWRWTNRGISFESFQKLANDRAEKGFTVGQLFLPGNGWNNSSSLLDTTYEHPDLDHIRYIENFIRYANSKGITVWINPWWTRRNLAETAGEQNIKRWWRYVIHRLGSYNVIWVLAGEYNMYNYGGLGLDFFKELGILVKNEDPYKRITSSHNTPPGWSGGADAPQWSTADCLHNEIWLDYNQCQVGHGNWRNEMIPEIVTQVYQQQPYKPIVVTEPWYEFIEGSAPAEDIRFGAWSAMLSGAAGHSYAGGHIWKAHVPESPVESASSYPMDMSFSTNTLDYPGVRSFAFMAKFLRNMEWWKLEPCPELISGNPSKFCSANPGVEYLVYLRWGGTVNINLTDAVNKELNYEWIDLTTGEIKKTGSVKGDKMVTFLPPESYPGVLQSKDWILHIYKK